MTPKHHTPFFNYNLIWSLCSWHLRRTNTRTHREAITATLQVNVARCRLHWSRVNVTIGGWNIMVYRRHTTPIFRPFRSTPFPCECSNIIYKYQSLYTVKCNPPFAPPNCSCKRCRKRRVCVLPPLPFLLLIRRWGGGERGGNRGGRILPLKPFFTIYQFSILHSRTMQHYIALPPMDDLVLQCGTYFPC